MKNIFKIAAIALMACPLLLTACKKDDPEPEPEPTPEPTPTATIDLTWDGAAQTLGFKDAYLSTNAQAGGKLYILDLAKGLNGENYELPEFVFSFYNGTSGMRLSADYTFTDNENNEYEGNDLFPTEVYEEGSLSIGTVEIGDYQLYGHNTTPTYGQFDATALTYTCNLNLKFYNFAEMMAAYQALGLGEDEEPTQEQLQQVWASTTTKDLTLAVNNWAFSATK